MAAITKPAKPKRTASVLIRFTPLEKAHIRFLAETLGLSFSEYCRRRALSTPLPRPSIPAVNLRLCGDLAHVTANINQIAKHLNSGRIASAYDLVRQLKDTRYEVERLRAVLVGLDDGERFR